MNETTGCPECGQEAHVEWRCVLESTDGPIEHAKIRCGQGHGFLLPLSVLARARATRTAASHDRSVPGPG